jgi:hypothetical protein
MARVGLQSPVLPDVPFDYYLGRSLDSRVPEKAYLG